MDIGFIGLGLMGRAMAANLVKAGHTVRVWNRSPGPAQELAKLGAIAVATAAEAFRGDAVLSMLANDEAVHETLLGGRLLESGHGTVHVNTATISVALAKELTALHEKAGIGYVAAPVFGRPDAAAAAMLNVVAAGAPDAMKRVQPLLDAIGQKTWHMGDEPLRANVVKVGGNFMLASAIETMGEASALAKAYGVEPAAFLDIMTNTLFASPAYKGYGAAIAESRYLPAGFRLPLGMKDVGLALSAGQEAHVPLPFASVLRDNFLDAIAQGSGDKDWAALAEVSLRRAGLPVKN